MSQQTINRQGEIDQNRSLEQKRAQAAWNAVKRMKGNDKAESYGQLARGAPADIQLSGLGPTLAFWLAKGGEQKQLMDDVSGWVRGQIGFSGELLDWIVNQAETDQYWRATAEALAFLAWVKRFAEAELIEKKKAGAHDNLPTPQ